MADNNISGFLLLLLSYRFIEPCSTRPRSPEVDPVSRRMLNKHVRYVRIALMPSLLLVRDTVVSRGDGRPLYTCTYGLCIRSYISTSVHAHTPCDRVESPFAPFCRVRLIPHNDSSEDFVMSSRSRDCTSPAARSDSETTFTDKSLAMPRFVVCRSLTLEVFIFSIVFLLFFFSFVFLFLSSAPQMFDIRIRRLRYFLSFILRAAAVV